MQLNRQEPADFASAETEAPLTPGAAANEMILEYEARRCHVCHCKYPSFGFEPPLTSKGRVLWACGEHRPKVSCMLRGTSPPQGTDPEAKLF